MSWKKVVFSRDDITNGAEGRLHRDFSNQLVYTPQPNAVRSYSGSDPVTKERTIFFDPAAVAIAGPLLDAYGAVDCSAPNLRGLEVFVERV